jgi:Pup amidohydrolase
VTWPRLPSDSVPDMDATGGVHFGLETEIGVQIGNGEDRDLVADSIAVVQSAREPGVWMRWDYAEEDPHLDMRGFRVRQLRQDTDEADYVTEDAARGLSYVEIKSDLVLGNGARFYNDHAHPEYCTPECRSVTDLVLQDRAGERILMACARELAAKEGVPVRLYKNNTDFFGHSYGCHENYLIPRQLAWDDLVRAITAFLVTRQIFAGAGKFAFESEDHFDGAGFQISQRSDFFSELQSVDTMQRRPIINTRDEPHANPNVYRRFHVILGDANMSGFATRLKVGSTALVLEAIARSPVRHFPQLADPLRALRSISRDGAFRWEVPLQDGRMTTAIEVQDWYVRFVRQHGEGSSLPEASELVRDWEGVIEDLGADPRRCRDRLDWVAKRQLIEEFQREQGLSGDDPWLRSLDLEYHRLDYNEGLYYALERSGSMRGAPGEAEVHRAVTRAPRTRAEVRGRLVRKFGAAITAAQWDHVTLRDRLGEVRISLLDLFAPETILRYCETIERARTPEDLRSLM